MNGAVTAVIVGAGITVCGTFAVGAWAWSRKRIGDNADKISDNAKTAGVNAQAINDLADRAKEQAALTQTVFTKIDEDQKATAKFRQHVCERLGAVCQELKIDGD